MAGCSTFKCVAISFAVLALSSVLTVAAHADPTRRRKQLRMRSPRPLRHVTFPSVLALYEDNAVVIWPGRASSRPAKPPSKSRQGKLQRTLEAIAERSQQRRARGWQGLHHSYRSARRTMTGRRQADDAADFAQRVAAQIGGSGATSSNHASAGLPPPPGAEGGKNP